jgi:hypothetical protein
VALDIQLIRAQDEFRDDMDITGLWAEDPEEAAFPPPVDVWLPATPLTSAPALASAFSTGKWRQRFARDRVAPRLRSTIAPAQYASNFDC